jgi:hypothetical protein
VRSQGEQTSLPWVASVAVPSGYEVTPCRLLDFVTHQPDTQDAVEMLVEEIERLREEQPQREQQLEQRPETTRAERPVPGT